MSANRQWFSWFWFGSISNRGFHIDASPDKSQENQSVRIIGNDNFFYGVLGAAYSAFQLVPLGKYSDKFGRKSILLVSQLGTLIARLLFLAALLLLNLPLLSVDVEWIGQFTLSLPLIVIFTSRALDGLTGGNISVANAYLVDISTEENRKSNFGKMAASSNLGCIIGPALAGVLGATALGEASRGFMTPICTPIDINQITLL